MDKPVKNIRSSYKRYLSTTENPIPVKDYVQINNLYNKFLVGKALQGHAVTLPNRMGVLSVQGRRQQIRLDEDGKPIGLSPDWVGTKKLWDSNPEAKAKKTLLYHLNHHTDGVRYKWNWSKLKINTENRSLYTLKMTRENKRNLSNLIKEGVQYSTKS